MDFVAEMVERAKANAARQGVALEGLVQEISQLDVPDGVYDLVWLSARMYSCLPTRQRRVEMLRRPVAQESRPLMTRNNIASIAIQDHSLWDRLGNKRVPLSFDLEITARCNHDCRHCYINLPANDRSSQAKELFPE